MPLTPSFISPVMLPGNFLSDMNAVILITFTGQNTEIKRFIDRNKITVTSQQKVTFYPKVNGSVINGNISEITLSDINKNLSINELLAASKSMPGSISLLPNTQITSQEFRDVSLL